MKNLKSKSGFTLVEMILYVGLFAIVLTLIVQLFWQVQLTEVKTRAQREVKENTSQVAVVLGQLVRQADDIVQAGSVFGTHPGVFELTDGVTKKIDTYTKNVTIGGNSILIRKLRLTEGASSYDITSDHVNVVNFTLTDLTPSGAPDSVQINFQIDAVNPDEDSRFDSSLLLRTGFNIRKEF